MPPRSALSSIDLSALADRLDAAPSPLPSRHRESTPDPEVQEDPEELDEGPGFEAESEDGGPDDEEEGEPDYDFGDDSEDAPPRPAARYGENKPDARWAFEAQPRGEAVAGYGAFQGGAAEISPPIWPGHKRYPAGSTTLMVQRINPVSGRREELGTLPGDATTLTLLRKFQKPGDYLLTPMDEQGEQLIQQPIPRAISPKHDAFQRIASEDTTAEALTGTGGTLNLANMRSLGGGDLAVLSIMRDNLVAERTERQLHQTKAETASERVVRAHELSTNRVLIELDKLNAARVDVERTLGSAQTRMLQEQNALQTKLQEKIMADQAHAYEKMADAHRALGEEQTRLAREAAMRAENLAKEQAAAAASSGNNLMAMMMTFVQAGQARAEQELARQQAQLALEAQRQRDAAEQARLEQARAAAAEADRRAQERADRESQREAEREERRLRMEEEESRRRADEAERKRIRDELEAEERKAQRRREEAQERREEERERREAEMERLRVEMLAKAKPADPTAWLTTATVALGALTKLAPMVRDLFGGGEREESEDKPTSWTDVAVQAMQALPALVTARTQQMQLEVAAAQGMDPDEGDDEDPIDEEEEEDVQPKGYAYQPPKPRLAPVVVPQAASTTTPEVSGPPTPPFPAQRRVREALQTIARAVEQDPALDTAGIQTLVTQRVLPIAGEFLQFAQWRGSLSATVAEGRPTSDASARIMTALDAYNGPGADFLKRLPR